MPYLSDTKLRSLRPREKPYKVSDERGLFLYVKPNGSMLWRMRYWHQGLQKLVSFGRYPDVSLAMARERRDEARRQLAQGINPTDVRKQEKLARAGTFEEVAMQYMEARRKAFAESTWDGNISILKKWLLPALGKRPIALIESRELLQALRKIEKLELHATAHSARALAGRVFRYAIRTGRCKHDITSELRGALAPMVRENHPAILDPVKIGALMRALRTYEGSRMIHAALNLQPYVFLRPGKELRLAVWSEIDLEGDEPIWRVPAERTKLRRPHLVPLARQSVAILRGLQPLTGADPDGYVFQGLYSRTRPISPNSLNAALLILGYGRDEQTPHGFRTMASTHLNELGFNRDWVEVQLAHAIPGVRGVYNHALFLKGRRRMMQTWADFLDALRDGKKPPEILEPGQDEDGQAAQP